jgi:hypothetical protein
MDAEGMLAVFLGTCEFLFNTVGRLNTASPALPIEIRTSTKLTGNASVVYPSFSRWLKVSPIERSTV